MVEAVGRSTREVLDPRRIHLSLFLGGVLLMELVGNGTHLWVESSHGVLFIRDDIGVSDSEPQ